MPLRFGYIECPGRHCWQGRALSQSFCFYHRRSFTNPGSVFMIIFHLPHSMVLPKQTHQISHPRHKKSQSDSYITPSHRIPCPHVQKVSAPHHIVSHRQMANIANGAGDQEISDHFWFRSSVEDSYSNEREQAI